MLLPVRTRSRSERGATLVELLLALAVAAAMLPFIIRQADVRTRRAENIKAAADLGKVKSALERYMEANRHELFSTISRNVVRVSISDLEEHGLDTANLDKSEQFQMRVVKSADRGGRSFLQGVVIMDTEGIAPIRTREIAAIAGGGAGFADDNITYGAFGTWRVSANVWNARFTDRSLLEVTDAIRSGEEFLRRIVYEDGGAMMHSPLALGGHDIVNARSVFAESARFAEFVNFTNASASRLVMEGKPTLDGNVTISGESTVSGVLSSDSRSMEVGRMTVSGTSRFGTVNANELWAGDLELAGFSVQIDERRPATLSVGRSIDMTGGRVVSMLVAVGHGGSTTPRLFVKDRVEDARNPEYFWDVATGEAMLSDIFIPALSNMARTAIGREQPGTESHRILSQVANNANATVADYMRALAEIERRVTARFDALNLE